MTKEINNVVPDCLETNYGKCGKCGAQVRINKRHEITVERDVPCGVERRGAALTELEQTDQVSDDYGMMILYHCPFCGTLLLGTVVTGLVHGDASVKGVRDEYYASEKLNFLN